MEEFCKLGGTFVHIELLDYVFPFFFAEYFGRVNNRGGPDCKYCKRSWGSSPPVLDQVPVAHRLLTPAPAARATYKTPSNEPCLLASELKIKIYCLNIARGERGNGLSSQMRRYCSL